MSLIAASMFNQPLVAVVPPLLYGGFDPAELTGSVGLSDSNRVASVLANALGRDNAGAKGLGGKNWNGTETYCCEITLVANDPAYPPTFHAGFMDEAFEFPSTFSAYDPADVFQLWRSDGNAFPGAGGIALTDGDVIGIEFAQAPTIIADATFRLYLNGSVVTTLACNIPGIVRPAIWSLYQDGIIARLVTNPADMVHAGSYASTLGWPY